MFRVIKNTINEVNKVAHLWPPVFKGIKSWLVNRPIAQLWRVRRRFCNHRDEGEG